MLIGHIKVFLNTTMSEKQAMHTPQASVELWMKRKKLLARACRRSSNWILRAWPARARRRLLAALFLFGVVSFMTIDDWISKKLECKKPWSCADSRGMFPCRTNAIHGHELHGRDARTPTQGLRHEQKKLIVTCLQSGIGIDSYCRSRVARSERARMKMASNLMEKLVFWVGWIALLQALTVAFCVFKISIPWTCLQCLAEPLQPQYGGGILRNADFSAGLQGWSVFGYSSVAESVSASGNVFAVAVNRSRPFQSVSQKVYLQNDTHYTLSAWLQVSDGIADVRGRREDRRRLRSPSAGSSPRPGAGPCSREGSPPPPRDAPSSTSRATRRWTCGVDSVSLHPFTKSEWSAHRAASTASARKKTVRLQATDSSGNPLAGAAVSLDAVRSAFPLGAAVSKYILTNTDYQSCRHPGREDYSVSDAMMAFARAHGVAVRGHNVFWDQPSQQPAWVQSLPYPQLLAAASRRIRSVVSRYAGQVIGWDVVNENLPLRLLRGPRLREIIGAYPENGAGMAIGLEGHFTNPNIPYMRAALDTLAQAGIPVWLTEVDVAAGPAQAEHLEEVLREAYAHPAVQGIVLWSAWHPEGCYVMCLTDNSFNNLPQGDVVDRLIAEWRATPRGATTDAQGYFEAELPHGEYKVTVSHPVLNTSVSRSVKVQLSAESEYFIDIRV
ncbi:hypothetical protein PR202_gb18936 [Eleusine coracana subsp. coracana]|uniref:GH10 domain-containing protein n=1 Tax=Eleusine coracana subsp. coracana TaxID=191504 RepID=A0AAV5F8H3_ELECO|nr:hypothetical protein PR202_gb18936 [Eleusine coracana subsp. coracana]